VACGQGAERRSAGSNAREQVVHGDSDGSLRLSGDVVIAIGRNIEVWADDVEMLPDGRQALLRGNVILSTSAR
jgi:hypothetical protein